METKKKKDDVLETFEERVKRITKPIFDKVLKETNSNTMRGVSTIQFLWRPHNRRLKVDFFQDNAYQKTLAKKIKGTPLKKITKNRFPVEFLLKNYNSKAIARLSKKVTIMADKKTITAIYFPSIKKERFWYLFKAKNIDEVDEKLDQKVKEVEELLIESIREFTSLFGGRVDIGTKEWIRHEDEIKGVDFIDKIPKDMIINDTVFKKVYPTGIEMKKPVYVKNTIKNLALKDFSPILAGEMALISRNLAQNDNILNKTKKDISELKSTFREDLLPFKDAIGKLTKQINIHLKVENKQLKNQEKMNTLLDNLNTNLTTKKKGFFMRWINYFKERTLK